MRNVKVLDISDGMNLECIKSFGDGKPTEYKLYLTYMAVHEKYGYYTKRRKQLAKYTDFESVIYHVRDMYRNGLSGKPIEEKLAWNNAYRT